MTTTPETTDRGVSTEGRPEPSSPLRFVGRLARPLYWPAILGLLGLNAWWAYDRRPLPELTEVAGLINAGKTEDAERALRAWVRRSPHYAEARLMLGRVLAGKGDLKGCAAELRSVPFWSPWKGEALYREAQTWLQADRAADAEAALRAYLADDPNHPYAKPFLTQAYLDLINLLSLENRWDEAREVIWEAFDHADEPAREEFLVMSLRTVLERSSPAASVETLRRYVGAGPDDVEARLALASAAQALGSSDEADDQITEALRLAPRSPKVWGAWMAVLKQRADFGAVREALAKAPPEVEKAVRPARAESLAQEGKLAEAFAEYEQAAKERPDDADLLYRFALVARRLGRTADEEKASRRHSVWRLAREALPEALSAYGREGRGASADPVRRVELLGRLSEICRDLGMNRDAREWAEVRDQARAKGKS